MTLYRCIAVSALLHAALLAAWPLHRPRPGGTAEPPLHVALTKAPDQVSAPRRAHAGDKANDPRPRKVQHAPGQPIIGRAAAPAVPPPVPAATHHAEAAIRQVGDDRTRHAPQPPDRRHAEEFAETAPPQPVNPLQSPGSSSASAAKIPQGAVVSLLRANLTRRIHAVFDYPLIARIKGWQGEVKLGMRVEPDGTLTDLRVIVSSGYAILDRSSLRTLQGIARIPPAAQWLQGRHVDLILPVEYRLTEGG